MPSIIRLPSWAIFPCVPNDKRPLTKNGFKDASENDKVIAEWFNRYRDANVGLATGRRSGVFVIDIDVKDEKEGTKSLELLYAEYDFFPLTVESATPSGGTHYFFEQPKDVIIDSRTNWRPGIDVRGDGGYVVIPPSSLNGIPYTWSLPPTDMPPAPAPWWLLELLKKEKRKIKDMAATPTTIEKGGRNDALTKLAGKLRASGLDGPEIEAALLEYNRSKCLPPLDDEEVCRIAASISRYEKGTSIEAVLSENYTDFWNAEQFAEANRDVARYCDALGGWFLWNGSYWRQDCDFSIFQKAKKTLRKINPSDKALARHLIRSESEGKIKAMLNLARGEGLAMQAELFDHNKYLINLQNGTFDLQEGILKPHNKKDFITNYIDIPYNESAVCPIWERFLADVFLENEELVKFMQRAVGYSLSGDTSEQCIFLLYGVGMNGKSTFLRHVFNILGSYARHAPTSLLTEKHNDGIPNDVARLKGVRFVTAVETARNKPLAEAQIKQLTGDDPIAARFLHKEFFDFFATFKIFFATNHKPRIRGTDKGIWRRMKTVPFERIITPSERDPGLNRKLEAEYEGILAWMIRGFAEWQKSGLGESVKINEATAEYKEESDVIGEFIDERCEVGESRTVLTTDLVNAAQAWLRDNGYRPANRSDICDYLKTHGFERSRGSGRRGWVGLSLKETLRF